MAAHKRFEVMVGVGVLVLCGLWLANTVWAQGEVSFIAIRDFLVGDFRVSLAAGDFNGDGRPDLAAANADSDTVSILLGRGDGTFATALDFGVGERPLSVVVGDFNGDGHPDLAVANAGSNTVSILLGRGDGTFQAAPEVGVGAFPVSVAVGDFNGDRHPDLATANLDINTVSILLGRGDGTFQAAPEVGVGAFPVSVAVGDFNGDRQGDLVVTHSEGGRAPSCAVFIRLSQGDGTFVEVPNVEAEEGPCSAAVGDFNGDGRTDLVVAGAGGRNGGDTRILLGQGDGTFVTAPVVAVVGDAVAIGDFNGDGHQDLAVVGNTVTILLGRGDGTFEAAPEVATGTGAIAVGDFNGDGRPDLATTNTVSFAERGTVSIRLGRGDGTFEAAPDVEVQEDPRSVAVGDFDGDSRPDLATAGTRCNDECFGIVSILLGRGDGTFEAAPDVGVGLDPSSVAVGDFNGDGRPDLATASVVGGGSVSIRLGQGDGTFQAAPDVEVAGGDRPVVVGDFNGDGRPDLATVSASGTVSILLGRGDGTFAVLGFEVEGAEVVPQSLAVGDFNGDGLPDVVTANAFSNTVSILINNTPGVVMNDFVSFEPLESTFTFTPDATGCPAGFVGTFSFEARLTNVSAQALSGLVVAVTRLTNFDLLQNADGGPAGTGARLTVPHAEDFTDGLLSPAEGVNVPFSICLLERQPFRFEVAVVGVADASAEAHAKESLMR